MKTIDIGDLKVMVCEHKGDMRYHRFVKFKQYAPQFWEKMDSPLFESYFERIKDHFDKGEFTNALIKLLDYRVALNNIANSYDAWGVCFALITETDCENVDAKFDKDPNDAEIKARLKIYSEKGLLAETVKEHVLAFMSASPETFQDHLIHYASQLMTGEMLKSEV